MFADSFTPRVHALPPGADFPRLLVAGLLDRMAGAPPEALARVELYVNTRRMQRRITALMSERGARLLPRIRLVTDPGTAQALPGLPPPVPPLRRRLQLAQLVEALLRQDPDLAPRAAIYDLADSLARLGAEMAGEGVDPQVLEALDVSHHARHWERALRFLRLVAQFTDGDAPEAEARQRKVIEALAARWAEAPPDHPVLVAGSTGSRGATALLMEAVARLPQGAVVLPGFDDTMPEPAWAALDSGGEGLAAEDHPQYRYRALMQRLGLSAQDIRPWCPGTAPVPARNALVSLALRPAPVTDQWMAEGPALRGIDRATRAMTLIEAPSPRAEALAIALRLRRAAEDGARAALITPDRGLARQVTAALERWRIVPDDSAGRPLALSAPGRFLRHVAALMAGRVDAEALVTLLKHPLTHSGPGRGDHLRHSRDLELHLRRRGVPFPDAALLRGWGTAQGCAPWADWLARALDPAPADTPQDTPQPLAELIARHRALAETLAHGSDGPDGPGTGALWELEPGRAARQVMDDLSREAPHGGALSPADYLPFVTAILQDREVRDPVTAHPDVMIWGTLEARVQGADLVILGGLNDGVWPPAPTPDPWLNRPMRAQAGLLLPERQTGLSAHDFQQAIAAPQVVLTRAIRDTQAQTVPSRWLNRLTNLLAGLPDTGGAAALAAMRARGAEWLALAEAVEADMDHIPRDARAPAPRPAPAPPVALRPAELPVTQVARLIRDPYAVYARNVLKLRALDPLRPEPDALLRGTVLHRVLEAYAGAGPTDDPAAQLMACADEVLDRHVPWRAARAQWRARLARVAGWFARFEAAQPGAPVLIERSGALALPGLGFTLTARPDRVDLWPDGRLHILDYKTGTPPSKKAQKHFDKQLLLEALIAEAGGFSPPGAAPVARVSYVGLGASPKVESTDITAELNAETRAGLERLIAGYHDPARGYVARRALFRDTDASDYDHLSRFGEWQMQDAPHHAAVGHTP